MYRNIRRPDRLSIPEVYLDDVFMKERYKRVEISPRYLHLIEFKHFNSLIQPAPLNVDSNQLQQIPWSYYHSQSLL
jgi:hypothetical protein